jgi:hypothetical protein
MRTRNYATWWQQGNGRRQSGKLELGPLHVLLSGSDGLALPLDEITSAEYARGELRVERPGEETLCIGSLDAPGALLELIDSLTSRLRLSAA